MDNIQLEKAKLPEDSTACIYNAFIVVDKVFLNFIFIGPQPFLSVEREINELGVYAKEHVQSKVLA